MKIIIYTLCCFILLMSNCYSQTGDNYAIKEFYEKLVQKTPPTESDEIKFFGMKSMTRGFITQRSLYKDSKTPVWDVLRANRELFIPIKMRSLDHITVSKETIEFEKLGSGKSISLKFAITFFRGKGKMRHVWFSVTSPETSLIDIDNTFINGVSGISIAEFFHVPDRTLKSIGIE